MKSDLIAMCNEVRFYYRPRVEAFIEHLRGQMAAGSTKTDEPRLRSRYRSIEEDFVSGRLRTSAAQRFQGTPVEAAAKVLSDRKADAAIE